MMMMMIVAGVARHWAACSMRWLHCDPRLMPIIWSVFSLRSSRQSLRYWVISISIGLF